MSSCPPPRDRSQKVWCFQCGSEYFPEVTDCIECGVPTTDQKPPDVSHFGKEGEENLAYDFHEWTGELRSLLDTLLNGAEIMHIWQGATLIARVEDEEIVDSLISEADLTARPSLGSEEKIEYGLEELLDSQVSFLTKTLEEALIPFEISGEGDLLVRPEDEGKVEDIFDRLTKEPSHQFGEVIDADVPYILSELLRLCVKLEDSVPLNSSDFTEGKKALDMIPQLSLPFGFSANDWKEIIDRSGEVANIFLHLTIEDEQPAELPSLAIQLKSALPVLL